MRVGLFALISLVCHGSVKALFGNAHQKQRRQSSNTDVCVTILAVADSPDYERILVDEIVNDVDGETFLCELANGYLAPIQGTDEQFTHLRSLLRNGLLVSAESTIEVTKALSSRYGQTGLVLSEGDIIVAKKLNGERSRWGRSVDRESNNDISNSTAFEGVKQVLVVRVSDSNGLVYQDSAKTMSDKIFGTYEDTVNLKSQLAACSSNKFRVTNEYSINISEHMSAPGVVDIDMPVSLHEGDRNFIRESAVNATEKKLRVDLPGPFDHIMFVLEGCYNSDCNWGAYAFVNSYLSVYKGPSYKFASVQMHEIGHNLNLGHSGGHDGETYSDHTCLMGDPYFSDEIGAMCFNPAKSFQIANAGNAWYNERVTDTQLWNPTIDVGRKWSNRIIGIADYNDNPNAYPVVVKIESGNTTDFFVGFNRATGINRHNKQASNEVTIVQAGADGLGYSQSFLKAALKDGESYVISGWGGTNDDVTILVNEINLNAEPAYASVMMIFGSELATDNPTRPPSKEPTAAPTPTPTSKTSLLPVLNLPYPSRSTSPVFTPMLRPTSPSFRLESVNLCGDTVCESGENKWTCPIDCSSNKLTTTYDFDLGSSGNMFTVKAVRDVLISSFSVNAMSEGLGRVKVFTRQGSYDGVETSVDAWELMYDNPAVLHRGRGEKTNLGDLEPKVAIAVGSAQSFYITTTNGLLYRRGDLEYSIYTRDSSLIVYEGIGVMDEFGVRTSPRIWNGVIIYDVVSAVDPCGDGRCQLGENSITCSSDCMAQNLTTTFEFDSGSNGSMFTVKAITNISIHSLSINSMSDGFGAVKVFTRPGLYSGHETDPSSWELVYARNSVKLNTRGNPTILGEFDEVVTIFAENYQSFYIWSENMVVYKIGSNEGVECASDSSLIVYEGIGMKGYFGPFISARIWSGILHYDTISSD